MRIGQRRIFQREGHEQRVAHQFHVHGGIVQVALIFQVQQRQRDLVLDDVVIGARFGGQSIGLDRRSADAVAKPLNNTRADDRGRLDGCRRATRRGSGPGIDASRRRWRQWAKRTAWCRRTLRPASRSRAVCRMPRKKRADMMRTNFALETGHGSIITQLPANQRQSGAISAQPGVRPPATGGRGCGGRLPAGADPQPPHLAQRLRGFGRWRAAR